MTCGIRVKTIHNMDIVLKESSNHSYLRSRMQGPTIDSITSNATACS